MLAVMAWASRCVLTVEEAREARRARDIFDTDEGSQFTAQGFMDCREVPGVRISMEGRGRCTVNMFIERLWRSKKRESAQWRELADRLAARKLVGQWTAFKNFEWSHSSPGGRAPWGALQVSGGETGRRACDQREAAGAGSRPGKASSERSAATASGFGWAGA